MNARVLIETLLKYWQLQHRDRWLPQRLKAYQNRSLHNLRKYAYARSPFYQQFHQGLYDRPLEELPVLTKAMMMERLDDLVTDRTIHRSDIEAYLQYSISGEYLERYWVTATSGSPGIFLFNHSEWTTIIASFMRAQKMMPIGREMRSAVVASTTPWHISARVSATLGRTDELRIDASEPIEQIVEKLNIWQPEVLSAYASVLYQLAGEKMAGRLEIEPTCLLSTSEVLTDEMRQRIEKTWKAPLFNQYAVTEAGAIAAECDLHEGLHLFEDIAIVEIVDENNRPVPPGVYGDKLLLTVLFNYTQPLIRYELSDSARLAIDPCPCGSPYTLIEDIQGRKEEILHLPAKKGKEVKVQPHTFHQILDPMPVNGWQVVRDIYGLHVSLNSPNNEWVDAELVDKLQRNLEKQGAIVPPIDVQHVIKIPRDNTGKTAQIKSILAS